jgi:hypothetical protein
VKIVRTTTVELDSEQYVGNWWSQIDHEVYIDRLQLEYTEEIDTDGRKIRTIVPLVATAFKIELSDLQTGAIDLDDVNSVDVTTTYELLDD